MGQIRWTRFVRSITREAADNVVASADYRPGAEKVRRGPYRNRIALAAAAGGAEFWGYGRWRPIGFVRRTDGIARRPRQGEWCRLRIWSNPCRPPAGANGIRGRGGIGAFVAGQLLRRPGKPDAP
jgi:hypothetical protein